MTLKKLLVGASCFAALAIAPAAQATNYTLASPEFHATLDPATKTISAGIQVSGIAAGSFTDNFTFTIPTVGYGTSGMGSGTVSTSTAGAFHSTTDLDFTSVTVNGVAATLTPNGIVEFASIIGLAITPGVLNTLTVSGISRGNGSYGGQLTYVANPAVPEAATWSMLLIGFGGIGITVRSRRRKQDLSFA